MTLNLNLDTEVVYAILAAVVIIVLIVNATRIMKLRSKNETPDAKPYDQQTTGGWTPAQ